MQFLDRSIVLGHPLRQEIPFCYVTRRVITVFTDPIVSQLNPDSIFTYSFFQIRLNFIILSTLTASVVKWPEILPTDPEVPGSIPGATTSF
jgi:hypothetical protein